MVAEPPFELIVHAEIGSTMETARLHVNERDRQLPFWCLAERQTSGRGRRGRLWQSPAGNFFGTLVFRAHPRLPMQIYTFMFGIAFFDALAELGPQVKEAMRLKWPNDLLLNGGKMAGLLAEAEGDIVYAGAGVNIVYNPQVEYRTAKLEDVGVTISPIELARLVHHRFFQLWRFAESEGTAGIMKQWAARGPDKGVVLRVDMPEKVITGSYEGVDDAGRLLLKTSEGLITVATGDVAF